MPKSAPVTEELRQNARKASTLWTYYRVRWTFLTRLCSSVPADPELIKKWIEVREPRVKPAGGRSIEEINEEVVASMERGEGEPDQSFSMLVFQRDHGHLVMRAATVRAHIKDCARQLSSMYIGKIEKEKSFAVRVTNGIYHDEKEYWLPVHRGDGAFIADADGAYDKPIHVRGVRGEQMNALKRFEFVEPGAYLEFTLKVMNAQVRRKATDATGKETTTTYVMPCVAEDDLHLLFEYGGTHGYAGERGDGEGRYEYTLTRLDSEK